MDKTVLNCVKMLKNACKARYYAHAQIGSLAAGHALFPCMNQTILNLGDFWGLSKPGGDTFDISAIT